MKLYDAIAIAEDLLDDAEVGAIDLTDDEYDAIALLIEEASA